MANTSIDQSTAARVAFEAQISELTGQVEKGARDAEEARAIATCDSCCYDAIRKLIGTAAVLESWR